MFLVRSKIYTYPLAANLIFVSRYGEGEADQWRPQSVESAVCRPSQSNTQYTIFC
jgi:hypothetical protein